MWKKYCVLFEICADNANADPNNIIFTIKDKKLYFPVVILSARDYLKFARSFYRNDYKTKSEKKNAINEYRYFPGANFV